MRAVIKCQGEIIDQQLEEWLDGKNWLPNQPQNSPLVEEHKKETLAYVPQHDRVIAESTHCLTLFDEVTRSWGTVCRPNRNRLTFRLKNPVSEKLKKACEKLVADIQTNTLLQFAEFKIEVLEPQGEHQAFVGHVLPSNRWDYVKLQKKTEYRVMVASCVIAILSLALTTPLLKPIALSPFSETWGEWFSGILERLGTTAFVTFIVSSLEVYLYKKDLDKLPPVQWDLD